MTGLNQEQGKGADKREKEEYLEKDPSRLPSSDARILRSMPTTPYDEEDGKKIIMNKGTPKKRKG